MPRNGTASKTNCSTWSDKLRMSLSAEIPLAEYEDIGERTALNLLETHRDKLPDLSSVCIFTPGQYLSTHFRQSILDNLPGELKAVIPPYVGTLRQWIGENVALASADVSKPAGTFQVFYQSTGGW